MHILWAWFFNLFFKKSRIWWALEQAKPFLFNANSTLQQVWDSELHIYICWALLKAAQWNKIPYSTCNKAKRKVIDRISPFLTLVELMHFERSFHISSHSDGVSLFENACTNPKYLALRDRWLNALISELKEKGI